MNIKKIQQYSRALYKILIYSLALCFYSLFSKQLNPYLIPPRELFITIDKVTNVSPKLADVLYRFLIKPNPLANRYYDNDNDLFKKTTRIQNKKTLSILEHVIPAKAGIYLKMRSLLGWIPAFAGMTKREVKTSAKPKIAFFSPMPAQESGIAYFTSILLPALSQYYDIDVFVDPSTSSKKIANNDFATIKVFYEFDDLAKNYHAIIYQLGNSNYHTYMYPILKKHPGIVVSHDFYLSSLLRDINYIYKNETLDSHGDTKTDQKRPTNLWALTHATHIIFHSRFNVKLMQEFYPNKVSTPVSVISLPVKIPNKKSIEEIKNIKNQLGFDKNDFLICSFGYIETRKMHLEIAKAFAKSSLKNNNSIKLVFAGGTFEADYLHNLHNYIKQNHLTDKIFITGYLSENDFNNYLSCIDIAIQLRSESYGETSGVVVSTLANGIPTILNNLGTFMDYPDDVVMKIAEHPNVDEIQQALEMLFDNSALRVEYQTKGREYIAQYTPEYAAQKYVEVIEGKN